MHDLIKESQIIKSHEFGSDTPPILHENKGIWGLRTTINPDYNEETQSKILTKTINEDNSTIWEYIIVPKTTEQFNDMADIKDTELDQTVIKSLLRQQITEVADEDLDTYASLFPVFKVGESIKLGDKRQYEDKVWKAIQAHVTQIDWLPPAVPALWVRVNNPEVILPWEQRPAENPYMIGDKCSFGGHTWESKIDTNTWSPESYPAGWTDLGEI
jgi:hypothetical protein